MIKGFFERLLGAGDSTASDADARLALTALLVRVARADFSYDAVEQAQIDKVISRRYALSSAETEALRHEAEAQARCMTDPNFREAYEAFMAKRRPEFS